VIHFDELTYDFEAISQEGSDVFWSDVTRLAGYAYAANLPDPCDSLSRRLQRYNEGVRLASHRQGLGTEHERSGATMKETRFS
jgi:hypothetical protein